ncbi:MAG: TIM44-like domain-containing protein [Myxococcales bacterium]|jgi:predicted lipid-binding transport protein (Tim44 family)/uncharacterized tellurite resistance protein B-like protein
MRLIGTVLVSVMFLIPAYFVRHDPFVVFFFLVLAAVPFLALRYGISWTAGPALPLRRMGGRYYVSMFPTARERRAMKLGKEAMVAPDRGAENGVAEAYATAVVTAHNIRQANERRAARDVARLKTIDPDFDLQSFLGAMARVLVRVRDACAAHDLDALRHLVSDGMLARFAADATIDRTREKRLVASQPRVVTQALFAHDFDGALDTVVVRFEYRESIRYELASGAAAVQSMMPATQRLVAEHWSFARWRNSTRKAALGDGKCPACADAIERSSTGACGACGAIVNTGAYDWILAGIAGKELTLPDTPPEVEGLSEIQSRDPGVSKRVLEDRAALIFWRWLEAHFGGTDRFERHCRAEARAEALQQIRNSAGCLVDVTVEAVDLACVEVDGPLERAWFRVRWKAQVRSGWRVRTHYLQLARRTGERTVPARGLATGRCPRCAARPADDATVCSLCEASFAEDWCFAGLMLPERYLARQAAPRPQGGASIADRVPDLVGKLGELSDPWERERALELMVTMARADGVVSGAEHRLLSECAERWSISPARLQELLEAPAEVGGLEARSPEEATVLFGVLVAASLADGKLGSAERKLLETASARLAVPPAQREAIVARMARELGE